jgi:hypothetical protein
LNRLKHDEFVIDNSNFVLTDVITVSGVDSSEFGTRKRSGGGQMLEDNFSIGIKAIGSSPIKGRGNRARAGGSGVDVGPSNKFSGRVDCINGREQVEIDKMVNESKSEAKGTASRKAGCKVGGGSAGM